MKKFINNHKNKFIIFSFLVLAVFVCFFIFSKNTKATDSGDRIHFISNEVGDSIIIESNGHYGLIDSLYPSTLNNQSYTDNGTKVLNYAKKIGVQYFDFVIMTHNHSDHIGGIPEIAELFNDKTIVFYKEDKISYNSNNQVDDFEELLDNGSWKNHELYEQAIQTFQSKNSILCDVTKKNQSVTCDLSLAHNDFISSVTYNSNSNLSYGSNMKEYVSFRFGDFDINLYNLYLISYHRENYNSIVTLLTHRTGGAKAVLTGDVEAGLGDRSFIGDDDPDATYLSNKSNLILQPTGNCTECTTLGIENQMADIIGEVTLLKSAHHGNATSNSYYALSTYKPKYFITQGEVNNDANGIYPYFSSSAASIIYLNAKYDTKSYFSAQATGAVVAQFNDDSSDTLSISKYNYDNNNDIVHDNQIDRMGSYYQNSWKEMKDRTLKNSERKWSYVKDNQPLINSWNYSDDSWYYFGDDSLMKTGFYEENNRLFYLSEEISTIGKMQTGWQKINGYWYYFESNGAAKRNEWYTVDNKTYYFDQEGKMAVGLTYAEKNSSYGYYYFSETESTIGIMQTGWQKINNSWYYFDSSTGKGKQNEFSLLNKNYYYFDNEGKMVTGLKYLNVGGFNDYYYFSEKTDLIGIMQTGWIEINGDWYYFDLSTGKARKNGWYTIGGNTYYFFDNAKMATGIQYLEKNNESSYYYFNHLSDEALYSNEVVVHIQNQADLDNYLNTTGHNITGDKVYFENNEDISFPEGEVFYLDNSSANISSTATYWYLTSSSKGNIDFNSSTFLVGKNTSLFMHATGDHLKNNSKQRISNGNFYGSVDVHIDNTNGSTYSYKGNFNADLIHASNIEFKNLSFNNNQDVNDHIFDVMGSNNITFDGLTFKGYFGNYTLDELKTAYSYSGHSLYAEAIQIDAANPGASGISNLDQTPIFNNSMSDGAASTNIVITNSYFGPYNGATGQYIIEKSNETVVIPYGPTIGSHDEDRVSETSIYDDIYINNNTFVNTIYMTEDYMNDVNGYSVKTMYPIHMQTHTAEVNSESFNFSITDNTFVNQYSGYAGYGTYVYGHRGYYGNNQNGNNTSTDVGANNTVNNATTIKSKVNKLGINQNGWKYVDGYWYYFRPSNYYDGGEEGTAVLGFATIDSNTYYLRTNQNEVSTGPVASMVKGFATINNNIYYFRNAKDDITTGPEGGMIKGLVTIDNNLYYFRETASGGTIGSMVKDECRLVDTTSYCFNSSGVGEVVTLVNIPTNSTCLNPTYDGTAKTLATSQTGYTLSNNSKTNAGDYTITASLDNGYVWSDYSQSDKTFECSISKANLPTPSVTSYNGVYDGTSHQVSLTNSSGRTVNYSTDGTNYSSTIPTRTNVGTTDVYVKYIGNENYNDSSVATGSITLSKADPIITKTNEYNEVVEGYSGRLLSISSNVAGTFIFSTSDSLLEITTGPIIVSANEVVDLNIDVVSSGNVTIEITFVPSDSTNYNSYQDNKNVIIEEQIVVNSVATIPTANDYCKNNLVYDGNEKTLTNNHGEGYTFINNTGTNAGEYTVSAVLDQNYEWSDSSLTNKTITCSISKASLPSPIVTEYNNVYDGTSHQVTLTNSSGMSIVYSTDGTNYSSVIPTRTNAGTTNVYVKYLGDSNHNDSSVTNSFITISKADPIITKTNLVSEFTIDDNKRVLTVSSNIDGMFSFSTDGDKVQISSLPEIVLSGESVDLNIVAIKKGTSSVNVSFVPSDTTNYNSYSFDESITVNNKIATIPTASDYCNTNLSYNENEQTLTILPGEGYSFINNTATNAGNYNVSAHLNTNYEWSDGTTSDKVIVCSINKVKHNAPIIDSYSGTYDGKEHQVTITNGTNKTTYYSTDGFNFSSNVPKRTNVGTTNVYVKYMEDSNYLESDVSTGSITINKANSSVSRTNDVSVMNAGDEGSILSLTANIPGTFTFTTSDNSIEILNNSVGVIQDQTIDLNIRALNEGSATVNITFTPNNEANYNGYSGTKSISINPKVINNDVAVIPTSSIYCKNNLVYSGDEQILTNNPGTGYTFINNTSTNAGEYTVSAVLDQNYEWSDNSTGNKTITCSISKSDLSIPTITGYSGTYDGNQHGITVSDIPGALVKYSLDNINFTNFVPTRTDVGTTQVYVKYIGDSNHNDSSVYSTNIVINPANSVISSLNLVTEINKNQELEIGPISSNTPGIFAISTTDSSILSTTNLYKSVDKNEEVTFNISGVNVGSASYTITFTPTSSNYEASSITTNIEVLEEPKTTVLIPTSSLYCKTNLKYTGNAMTITNEPSQGYTFSNNVQTNPGTYLVTAKLNDGYIWSDNTFDDKTFNCVILNADSYLNFDSKLRLDSNNLIRVRKNPGVTNSEIKSLISTNGIVTTSGDDNSIVKTCDTLSIELNDIVQIYKLIITGDITKNGLATTDDVNLLFRYLRNKVTLDECQLKASDTTDDNELHINDVAKLYQYVNGRIGGLSD